MPLLLNGEGFILMEEYWRVSREEFWGWPGGVVCRQGNGGLVDNEGVAW